MDDKIIQFPGTTSVEIEPENDDISIDAVLVGLMNVKDKLDNLIVIGSAGDGRFYFASSTGDSRQIIYDLESAKHVAIQYGINLRDDIIPEGFEPHYD